ncbi:helix-turn-helix transcriptional regulator [Sebaldella sp. S0638]|uniref:helix-turn-helix domain-containing protein n=1 Tax=Sebaldella sp. S0638 TaxID=2957809 RepID=UPI00209D0F4D|nr:helix-turn-helix transcriptional regulator [Sebaldella sp. S0638]MCP1224778.1 helix-turn-helix domain-containing protein [Sebaldella sp. S0638]
MFKVTYNDALKLGEILKELRHKKELTFKELEKATGIDSATLSRLEQGTILRINPLILKSLADFYAINLLTLYNLINYITEDDILNYYTTLSTKKELEKEEIEIVPFNSFNEINSTYSKDFLKFPYVSKVCRAIEFNKEYVVIFNPEIKVLNTKDIGVFKNQDDIFISNYYKKEKTIVLINYFDKKITVFNNLSDVKILGKVVAIINYNL